jgi:hypothetical protein
MGGFNRKLKREAEKREYRKFCKAFGDEKSYRLYVVKIGQELPKGQELLGRKPTFIEWKKMTEEQRLSVAEARQIRQTAQLPDGEDSYQERTSIPDLDWEEEENMA